MNVAVIPRDVLILRIVLPTSIVFTPFTRFAQPSIPIIIARFADVNTFLGFLRKNNFRTRNLIRIRVRWQLIGKTNEDKREGTECPRWEGDLEQPGSEKDGRRHMYVKN